VGLRRRQGLRRGAEAVTRRSRGGARRGGGPGAAAATPRRASGSVAKSKSKTILVKLVSQAGTGFSFNHKRSRLREKLSLLHYDPIVNKKVLFVEQKKIRSL
ncbi:mitochondrial ribosomal protein L33, isoform CRA_b, partial [Mus musculus]